MEELNDNKVLPAFFRSSVAASLEDLSRSHLHLIGDALHLRYLVPYQWKA